MMAHSSISEGPLLSVIVPTYNRRDVLLACLSALRQQTVDPATFEVIVGDDGSTDGTEEAVRGHLAPNPPTIRYFRQENGGPSAVRNRAIREARGAIVLIINDDTILSPRCLERHLEEHSRFPDEPVAVLGRVTLAEEIPRSIFTDLHLDATFTTYQGLEELGWHGFITANLSVKRSFLVSYGLFEESMFPHEDLELGERLHHHGLRIRYRADAVGYHLHELTERDFLRMATRDGRSLARWYRKSVRLADQLFLLGLQGDPPLRKKPKHRIADWVITRRSFDGTLRLARLLLPRSPSAAAFVYQRLYQHLRRRAIAEEMALSNQFWRE